MLFVVPGQSVMYSFSILKTILDLWTFIFLFFLQSHIYESCHPGSWLSSKLSYAPKIGHQRRIGHTNNIDSFIKPNKMIQSLEKRDG